VIPGPEYLVPLLLTLRVAGAATAAALVLGTAAAWGLTRRDFPGRRLIGVLCTLPLVLPPTVLGYYLLVLLGRRGIVGRWLTDSFGVSLVFTWQGAAVASAVVAFPLVFQSARAAFEGVGRRYEDAARTLGLNETGVFLRVSLPLAMPGIAAGAVLAFARAMGEFGATLMVAGNIPGKTQTVSLAVYNAVQSGDDALAAGLVGLITVVSAVILWWAGWIVKSNRSAL
jgi:molybdate transport system permease protein